MKNEKTSLLRRDGFQTLLASLVCILGGLIVGWLVLLVIEPSGAFEAIVAVLKSFFRYPGKLMLKYLGQTLTRTVPLLMCALSVLFAYKVGMFNIGVAGQYVAGACAGLYAALAHRGFFPVEDLLTLADAMLMTMLKSRAHARSLCFFLILFPPLPVSSALIGEICLYHISNVPKSK